MNELLLEKLRPFTEEEQRLLCGEPLDMHAYRTEASEALQGARLIPHGQMITLRPHTRFCVFPQHAHDFVEIMYMLEGQAVHTLANGEQITLRAGELILLNRYAKHSIGLCGARDLAVNFIVQPAFFDFALEMVGPENALGRFLLDALRKGESDVPYLYFQISDVESVQSLLQSMLWSFWEQRPMRGRISRIGMGLLFLHLLSLNDRMRFSDSMRKWNGLALELLCALRLHATDFSLKAFAKAHGVSASYVSRIAREATGRNCTELLQEYRLDKAKQLLRETDQSVVSISSESGYSNNSYFYRIFEKNVGCSPKAYRSSHRT